MNDTTNLFGTSLSLSHSPGKRKTKKKQMVLIRQKDGERTVESLQSPSRLSLYNPQNSDCKMMHSMTAIDEKYTIPIINPAIPDVESDES
jgi:hypothetical protein